MILFLLVPITPLSKTDSSNTRTGAVQSDHSPTEHNSLTYTMSSSSHDAGSPPPEINGIMTPNLDKKNKKKLSLGGSFTKFWKGNKKVKDNGKNNSVVFFMYTITRFIPSAWLPAIHHSQLSVASLACNEIFVYCNHSMVCVTMVVFPQ